MSAKRGTAWFDPAESRVGSNGLRSVGKRKPPARQLLLEAKEAKNVPACAPTA